MCTIPALRFSQQRLQTGSELLGREIWGFSRAVVSRPWGAEGTRRACRAADPVPPIGRVGTGACACPGHGAGGSCRIAGNLCQEMGPKMCVVKSS